MRIPIAVLTMFFAGIPVQLASQSRPAASQSPDLLGIYTGMPIWRPGRSSRSIPRPCRWLQVRIQA